MTIFRLLVLFILLFPAQILSQGVQFGVDWEIPESLIEQNQQLKEFRDNGISVVQIEGIVDQSTIELIQSFEFELWISSGIKFLRPSDFPVQQNLIDFLTDPLYYYRNNSINFERYTLFEHPLKTDSFDSNLPQLIDEAENIYSGKIDILTSNIQPDFSIQGFSFGHTISSFDTTYFRGLELESVDYFRVLNSAFSLNAARHLRDLLANKVHKEKTWILGSDIVTTMESNPDLSKVIKGFAANKNAVVTLGPEIVEEDSLVFVTVVILILITLFVAIFSTNASYQRSLIRYLLTHNFFINDVMMKRTRLTGAVPLSWLLSLLFGVLLLWITIDKVFNDVTIEMLKHHHPFVGNILADGVVTTISFGLIGMFLIQLLSFLWISAATFGKSTISQISQIFLIPYQIVIPLTIVASLFYLNSNSPMIFFYSFWVFVFIMLIPVPMTCIDILRQSQGKKSINWLLGPVLFVIIVTGLTIYTIQYTSIPATIQLIVALI